MKNTEFLHQNPYQASDVFEARDKSSNNVGITMQGACCYGYVLMIIIYL